MVQQDEQTPARRGRPVLDGAAFGVYEDDERESRPPVVALAVVGVLALVVGGLVWWAVTQDAQLDLPTAGTTPSTASTPTTGQLPSTDDLLLLVPSALASCEPADVGTDGPPRAVVRCPGPPGLERVEVSLYASVPARDDAFDFLAGILGAGTGDAECALGRFGGHDYLGVEQVGRVVCAHHDGRTDLVWTSDAGAILAVASSTGGYADAYRAWADLVDRTGATFPTGVEEVLLDQLPDVLLDGCERDVDGALSAGGDLAVTCRPDGSPATRITWIDFADAPAADGWLAARRDALTGPVADDPGACTPDGYGTSPEAGVDDTPDASSPPPPTAGFSAYELDGTTGTVLCPVDGAGRPTVVWVRDAADIASVAVADDGVDMRTMLSWWQLGGYLP